MSFLGIAAEPVRDGFVLADIGKREWGDDLLGWEVFLEAIGVATISPSGSFGSYFPNLGQRLCAREWWTQVGKFGPRVMSYVMKRCSLEGSFLGALPVSLPSSGKESAFQRRVCLKDYFLHDVYACLGGSYLRYIKLPDAEHGNQELVRNCLASLGLQVELTLQGLLKALRMVRANGCVNIEVYADIYKAMMGFSSNEEQRKSLSQLVFVPSGFKALEECTWEEDSIQWLTKVPSLQSHYHRYGPALQRYFLEVLQMPKVHPGFRSSSLLAALRGLVEHIEKALGSRNLKENLPVTPTTASQLISSMQETVSLIYAGLAQACRRGSITSHTDVRRAFVEERLLLLPALDPPTSPDVRVGSNQRGQGPDVNRTRRQRPKRLYAKEAWWEVVPDLMESKATELSLQPLYGRIEDAEFLFLRVIGIRKVCSRVDIAHRLKASMNSIGPLSNWAEGIDITDLEELENVQTSSYFRPPDWRAPDEETQRHIQEEPPAPPFQPPPARASAHPPAWRSDAAAADAARRAEAALEAQRQRQERQRQQSVRSLHPSPQPPSPPPTTNAAPPSRTTNGHFSWREPKAAPAERRQQQKLTWSHLRARQDQGQREPTPACASLHSSPNATTSSTPKPESAPAKLTRSGTRAAWTSFSRLQAASEDRAEPTEDADVLMARLDALRQTAQKRRGELQSLRQECQQVEDTTSRYLRILQEFYDNM